MVSKQKKSIKHAYAPSDVIKDYRLVFQSRQASLIGRREVLSGKAKFGIFGGGKELAQIAMAKVFRKGDFRSGYYRDQTLMFALGEHTLPEYFAQLYAHTDLEFEPATGGRSMNAHFATRSLDSSGNWNNLMDIHNSASDISPTGSQMPRLVGLAYASKLYRELNELSEMVEFSNNGDEIAFGTIGNASCAEGMFWETINAIGVLNVPAVISIWDDDYGISVPNEIQLTNDLSELLKGFQRGKDSATGFELFNVKAWDYPNLIKVYQTAASLARKDHIPSIIHVVDTTQPQGHSTSGSHERYKSPERMQWEKDFDCNVRFRLWIVENKYCSESDLDRYEQEDKDLVEGIREQAWDDYKAPILNEIEEFSDILDEIHTSSAYLQELNKIQSNLKGIHNPQRQNIMESVRAALILLKDDNNPAKQVLIDWRQRQERLNRDRISSHLISDSQYSALNIKSVAPQYSENSLRLNGFEIINHGFDQILANDPRVIAFGEDLGKLGGVNQGFAGLQEKYGDLRVSDTGIRETTIIGQAIGLAMRGLKPIAEIQYLDYLLYCLQIISDDLATLHWRTKGGQKAPVIIRTRGHRLEGIWHSGSPMAGIIHLVRGMHVAVPRNMVQAVGFYNTLLESDDPGIVVEVLNGYRKKERLPDNIGEIRIPLGVPEILKEGIDITVVTYGPLCGIALEAAELLDDLKISAEIIDAQTLLPFDIHGIIVDSIKKTSRVLFLDEDVPGGASAYMLQEVIEKQGGYYWLDSEPKTLTSEEHRPAYGTDGNYWSKPNIESVFEKIYEIMNEADPNAYPMFYK